MIVVESMLQPHNPAIYILPFILLFSGRVEDIALKMVHFIIPLAGRYDTLKRFLNNFEKVCLVTGENVKLVVILFKVEDVDCLVPRFFFSSCEQMVLNAPSLYFLFQGPENGLHSDEDIVQLVDDLRIKYPSNDLRVIHADGPFNRGASSIHHPILIITLPSYTAQNCFKKITHCFNATTAITLNFCQAWVWRSDPTRTRPTLCCSSATWT